MAALIVQRPSPESDTRPANLRQRRILDQCRRGKIEQPRSDHAAASPDLRDVGEVEIVLIVLGIAQRRRFGIDDAGFLADVGGFEDAQPLGIGRHHAVFDAVMHHLDEMAGAVRSAMQIALLGCAVPFSRPGVRGMSPRPGASVAKIGSRCFTTSASPPIIMQ